MTSKQLFDNIKSKRSFLCIGLDTDVDKIPPHLLKEEDPVFEFNKLIIDATSDLCVAYKPNIAFYESMGIKGWKSLEKTLDYIPDNIFTIADAKRGDIGNTASRYAKTFFETYAFDSITIAPYMGKDSVTPFLSYDGKWAIMLALTSNEGALDFQMLDVADHKLFEEVLIKSKAWGSNDNMMFVVGATRGELIEKVRTLVPEHFFLVPGVGAQGGSLEEVAKYGLNDQCGLLVNSSRGIIYAGNDQNFDDSARKEAMLIQQQMEIILKEYSLID